MNATDLLDLMGRTSSLLVKRRTDAGYLLAHGEHQILLPKRLASRALAEGESISVFIYTDSEDRPVATMQKPLGQVGEFACLKVVDQSPHGCFLDWGLDKDLFCPHAEQHTPMRVGQSYVVAIYLDNHTGRVAAASRLAEFLDYELSELKLDQEVQLLVFGFQARGAQVIVNDRYAGIVYTDRNFTALRIGDRLPGYIDAIRADNKLDIRLRSIQPTRTVEKIRDARSIVLQALTAGNGVIPLGDKSAPEQVYQMLGISKKAFKAAVGQLYKDGLVTPGAQATELIVKQQS